MRVLVGLSGGADSAYAALRLLRQGHEVAGLFLRFYDGADDSHARYTARALGIELFEADARARFSERIIAPFCAAYAAGQTPNPCALCNREVKLACLCEEAKKRGFERAATGHYARIGEQDGRFFVGEAADRSRDQSYFLWRVKQEELSMLLFPLAGEQKREILPLVATYLSENTRESREICFIPEDDTVRFLEEHLSAEEKREGEFVDATGKVLGHHRGVFRYTVGQRRGFGSGFGERLYVSDIDAPRARITLGKREEAFSTEITLTELSFQKTVFPAAAEYRGFSRLRYRAPLQETVVRFQEEGRATLQISGAGAIAAPGQGAVLYDEQGEIVCGGVIAGKGA